MNDRQFAWEQLKPFLNEITGAISIAPLNQKDKNGLAIAASVHFMGVAARFLKDGDSQFEGNSLAEISKVVSEMVIAAMELDEGGLNG
jgi:hypothetical protein